MKKRREEICQDHSLVDQYGKADKTVLAAMEELLPTTTVQEVSDAEITKYWKRQNCFGHYLEGLVDGSKWMRYKFLNKE